jgi:hypothetical protein
MRPVVVLARRWNVTRRVFRATLVAGVAWLVLGGLGSAVKAQDWTDYLHWPYSPPQNPGSGAEYNSLHDVWYLYPREQRIVPQIQGPYYRNFYGGKRILGMRNPHGLFHDWNKKKLYTGNHFMLDVF